MGRIIVPMVRHGRESAVHPNIGILVVALLLASFAGVMAARGRTLLGVVGVLLSVAAVMLAFFCGST
jgi:hypothetical protein